MGAGSIVARRSLCRILILGFCLALAHCGEKELAFYGRSAEEGGTPDASLDDCPLTSTQIESFFRTRCASCHAGPSDFLFAAPTFNDLVERLVTGDVSQLYFEPLLPLLFPGDPDHSLVYSHIATRMHPHNAIDGWVPTVSDLSLLRFWITDCLPGIAASLDASSKPTPILDAGGTNGEAGRCLGGAAPRVPGGPYDDAAVSDAGPPHEWPSDEPCAGDQLPIVGRWVGYVENIMFSSGSDALRIEIRAANAAHVCGSVTLGGGMPPPSPTDPDVGYPVGVFACAEEGGNPNPAVRDPFTFDSFPMTLLDGRTSGARLQFQATVDELWRPWCELQTSYPAPNYPGGYACTPLDPCLPTAVDCGKALLCSGAAGTTGPCRCTAQGCTANPWNTTNPWGLLTFDLRFNGTSGDGSVNVGSYGSHNLHVDQMP